MTCKSFEELPVWQEAAELFEQIDAFLEDPPAGMRSSFRNQLDRAVLWVSNNIAGGFERGTTDELLHFIYIARGSAGEVREMLCLARRRPWSRSCSVQLSGLTTIALNCSKQLRGWADSLQNSELKGPRYLNKATRQRYEDKQKAIACQKKLLEMLPPEHPLQKQKSQL